MLIKRSPWPVVSASQMGARINKGGGGDYQQNRELFSAFL